ncbi:MAG: UMP kinase [archaeon]
MKYVISLGGSVIIPSDIDINFLSEFSAAIKELSGNNEFSIVCGGGANARRYVDAARKAGASDKDADIVGIQATLLNAALVSRFISGNLSAGSPKKAAKKFGKVPVVSGGYKPGWTTDVDAAVIAKEIGADALVNVTNVDHVYDSDPRENPNAAKIEKISWKDFLKLPAMKRKPGAHYVFDPKAAKICMKSGIKVFVIGSTISNLKNCLEGKNFTGTTIS